MKFDLFQWKHKKSHQMKCHENTPNAYLCQLTAKSEKVVFLLVQPIGQLHIAELLNLGVFIFSHMIENEKTLQNRTMA